jgi:hypothetical protein
VFSVKRAVRHKATGLFNDGLDICAIIGQALSIFGVLAKPTSDLFFPIFGQKLCLAGPRPQVPNSLLQRCVYGSAKRGRVNDEESRIQHAEHAKGALSQ